MFKFLKRKIKENKEDKMKKVIYDDYEFYIIVEDDACEFWSGYHVELYDHNKKIITSNNYSDYDFSKISATKHIIENWIEEDKRRKEINSDNKAFENGKVMEWKTK